MPAPKKGEPGYEEYRAKYNARRKLRQVDPAYMERYRLRKAASVARVKERRKAEEWERRHGKDG